MNIGRKSITKLSPLKDNFQDDTKAFKQGLLENQQDFDIDYDNVKHSKDKMMHTHTKFTKQLSPRYSKINDFKPKILSKRNFILC